MLKNSKLFLNRGQVYREIKNYLQAIQPDFVMADFEYFVPRTAKKMGIPVIQISHQYVLVNCKYHVPWHQFFHFLSAYIVSRLIIIKSQYEMGISFYNLPVKKSKQCEHSRVFRPILRKDIINAVSEEGSRVLVYFSCETFAWVIDILKQINDVSFVVYGLKNKSLVEANVEYKPISPTTFQQDLITARAVITNGGHTLVSEAIHLNKPLLAFYVKGQFEQFLNAYYLDKLKFGKMVVCEKKTEQEIRNFLNEATSTAKYLKTVDICGNKDVLEYLKRVIIE